MTLSCIFCELTKNPETNPTFIAEFDNSVAFLNFDQEFYPGYSILMLKSHYDHLHMVPEALQQAIVPEMNKLTIAILSAFGGNRANHQSLGNQVSHVHWHIVPRYPNDKMAGGPPYVRMNPPKLSDDKYREIVNTIRQNLRDAPFSPSA